MSEDLSPKLFRAAAQPLQNSISSMDRMFLCPVNPVTEQLHKNILTELISNYSFDGIHFDYIRFPHSQQMENMLCGCNSCEELFKKKYPQFKNKDWPPLSTKTFMNDFSVFKQDCVSELLRSLTEHSKKIENGLYISAAVFPNISSAKLNLAQNWVQWFNQKIVDGIFPMCYTQNHNQFIQQLQEMSEIESNSEVDIVVGNGPMHTLNLGDFVSRLQKTRLDFDGEAIYAYELLNHDTKEFYYTTNRVNQALGLQK